MKYLWKVIGIYLAFLAQSLLFENINILSVSPNILLAVIIMCSVSLDFVPASECAGKKPDLLYIFGADYEGESEFYHDKENDIYGKFRRPKILSILCNAYD